MFKVYYSLYVAYICRPQPYTVQMALYRGALSI